MDGLEALFPGKYSMIVRSARKSAIYDKSLFCNILELKSPAACYATDRIVKDGRPVGYMYREKPGEEDLPYFSGWNFFAGDEPDYYLGHRKNLGIYRRNTIELCDPSITPYLSAPYGAHYRRDASGKFVRLKGQMKK